MISLGLQSDMKDEIKKFYSELNFPGPYQLEDFDIYKEHGIFNRYLKEVENVLLPGQHVLDVGCGTGMLTNLFASRCPDIKFTAVDFSNSIEYGREFSLRHGFSHVNWVKQDFLEFSSDTRFDVIVCCGVLHHIPEYGVALAKIRDLLSDNGKLVLSVYNPWGKAVQRFWPIRYHSNILYQDQELNPFEVSWNHRQVLNLCQDFKFVQVSPSINNRFVDWLALTNSQNGGLAVYVFEKK